MKTLDRTPAPTPPVAPRRILRARVHPVRLFAEYFERRPDPSVPAQRVAFGTSGHRGSSLDGSFNEDHVLAIAQALCDYRRAHDIGGPLFLGIDTHALSVPARDSALQVLAANGVEVMLAAGDDFTPTPAVSLAIVDHNRGRSGGSLADGIVLTPSHNPPRDGGFKYNPPHGGPAGTAVTRWIEDAANRHLEGGLRAVKRMARPLEAATTRRYDFRHAYVDRLDEVVDLQAIRNAGLRLGVDPLGGAGVHYWPLIAERHGLDLTLVGDEVDPTFAFVPPDLDGRIRMDPASPFAMRRLVEQKDRFDVAFGCDPDHDRHGIVTPAGGLLPPNHYLAVAVDFLFRRRPRWGARAAVGKTAVTTALIDRVAARLGRRLFEVPVGFKWFAAGLADGSLGFGGEESAGASFLRRDGSAWTTDKDGIAAALLAAEITACSGRDIAVLYDELAHALGTPVAGSAAAAATPEQKRRLAALSPAQVPAREVAGEPVLGITCTAPGNGETLGGLKLATASGWFAARPSGTEALTKIYAESFTDDHHLRRLLREAQAVVDAALASAPA